METKNIAYIICAMLVGYLLIGIAPSRISQFTTPRVAQTDDERGTLGMEDYSNNDTTVEEDAKSLEIPEGNSQVQGEGKEQPDESLMTLRGYQIRTENILFLVADFIVAFTVYRVARRYFS